MQRCNISKFDGREDGVGHQQQQETTPFNPRNVLLTHEQLSVILRNYGHNFPVRDVSLFRKALTHRSYCTRKNENFVEGNASCPAEGCLPLQEESNERLEFLGDAVLNLVVASYLFQRYPDENEGFLTRMRTKLVNGNILAELFRKTGLENFTIISKQIEDNNGRFNKNVMEDCFEAFLGAVFVDGGDQGFIAAETWLINFLESNVDFPGLIAKQNNYKDMLAKYFQHAFNCMPRFIEVDPPITTIAATASTASFLPAGANSGEEDREDSDDVPATNTPSASGRHSSKRTTGVGGPSKHHGSHGSHAGSRVCVRNSEGMIVGTGSGPTKKAAENEAAYKTLLYYGQITP